MIIPIGHDQSIRRWPHVTIGIIVLCTLMHAYVSFGGPSEEEIGGRVMALAAKYELTADPTPEQTAEFEREAMKIVNGIPSVRFGYRTGSGLSYTLLTSAFVHDGWLHLIGNMLFLWLAGSAVEDRYGRMRFALFYALGAIAATYAFALTASAGILLIGASGAVSACMGAFLLHFHRTQIRFWYLLFYRSGTFQMAAWIALPLWLAEQFLWVGLDSGKGGPTSVAYAAHIGGFAFGLVAGFAMSKLFPDDDADDEVVYDAPSPAPAAGKVNNDVEERVDKLHAALDKRDVAAIRMLSSRVILDLARTNNDGRVIAIYQAVVKVMPKAPLTVSAFAAAALAADRRSDPATYVSIADAMIAEHPLGLDTPKVMWRLSQLHGDAGRHDLEKEALVSLAKRFPRDDYGQRAARSLDAS